MSDNATVLYEGLFLINQQQMAGDLAGAIETVRQMLDRAGAEVVTLTKWDERKLAYPVKGQKRGLYILALFRVRPVQVANIERDCNLSELVLRVMITRGDHLGEIEIQQLIKESQERSVESSLRAGDDDRSDDDSDELDDSDVEETEEASA